MDVSLANKMKFLAELYVSFAFWAACLTLVIVVFASIKNELRRRKILKEMDETITQLERHVAAWDGVIEKAEIKIWLRLYCTNKYFQDCEVNGR